MNATGGNWSSGSCAGGFSVGFNAPNFSQVSIGLRDIYVDVVCDWHYECQAFNKYFGLEFVALKEKAKEEAEWVSNKEQCLL